MTRVPARAAGRGRIHGEAGRLRMPVTGWSVRWRLVKAARWPVTVVP